MTTMNFSPTAATENLVVKRAGRAAHITIANPDEQNRLTPDAERPS